MKKLLLSMLVLAALGTACQSGKDNKKEGAAADEKAEVALCEFTSTDSATAVSRLTGKWELKGVQTNYMGAREDEFLTGAQITEASTIIFFENGEFEQYVNGKLQGERQPYKIVGQSLTPVGYQFWFCDEKTLVLNNVVADGATDVYVKQ
ncbi:hypothetical protein TH63_00935 [Rufibacter radiotolerans]|uniref:Lipocalin-like domain-containing protein n=1 Tax=Rufibacter radiotolerans TaxID=1379910 RepID=A0A0H4W244_9BACT|nr:hypothetical protein [Rufibacter radiotolerans]AKQ44516.1 hypothetical protein TH63_00935 [Rufibacter radiotolerans]